MDSLENEAVVGEYGCDGQVAHLALDSRGATGWGHENTSRFYPNPLLASGNSNPSFLLSACGQRSSPFL